MAVDPKLKFEVPKNRLFGDCLDGGAFSNEWQNYSIV